MTRPQLVVLDLVGTTVVADDAVPRAFTEALAAEGVTLDATALSDLRGATKRRAIDALLSHLPDGPARAARAYRHFVDALLDAYAPGNVIAVPGARDAIDRFTRAGAKVALNTGFDRVVADHVLEVLGWQTLTDAVVCGDEVLAGRPAPYLIFRAMERTGVVDVGDVASVGDTTLDLGAGSHARVGWNIGVWSGAHDVARLRLAPHTHLCASVADVPDLVGC